MRKAAKSLLLLGARRAYNAWTEMCAEAQERRARMRGALNSLLQLGSRRALNAWRAMAAEVGAARRKAAGAARTFGPEGRMQRAARCRARAGAARHFCLGHGTLCPRAAKRGCEKAREAAWASGEAHVLPSK